MTTRGRRHLVALPLAMSVVSTVLASALAHAEPAGATSSAKPGVPLARALTGDARVLYDSARELYKKGDYASAYAKFNRALELSHDPRLYWNLAACERKVKHNANVLRLIDAYLREGGALLSDDDKQEAERAASAVRAFVAAARVRTDPESGVEVFVDDVRIATTPIDKPLWIDQGAHRIRFAKAEHRAIERSEEIPAGGDLDWSVTLERDSASAGDKASLPVGSAEPTPAKSPSPPPPRAPDASTADGPSRVGPVVLGVSGLFFAGTGAALVLVTSGKFSDLQSECGTSCDPSKWESHRTTQIVGDVLLGVGVVALAAGVVWWIALPSKGASAEASPRAYVAPSPRGFVSGVRF